MRIEFEFTLDGYAYSEAVSFPDGVSTEEIEKAFKDWANEIFLKKTGGADGCELLLSNIKHNISN